MQMPCVSEAINKVVRVPKAHELTRKGGLHWSADISGAGAASWSKRCARLHTSVHATGYVLGRKFLGVIVGKVSG